MDLRFSSSPTQIMQAAGAFPHRCCSRFGRQIPNLYSETPCRALGFLAADGQPQPKNHTEKRILGNVVLPWLSDTSIPLQQALVQFWQANYGIMHNK
jgi:hypothetical protein